MGRLTRAGAAVLAGLLAAGCATAPPPAAPEVPRVPAAVPGSPPAGGPGRFDPPSPPPAVRRPGTSPQAGLPPAFAGPWTPASPLDLASWPAGWVEDSQAFRLGLPVRFWSDQRLLWKEVLDPWTPAAAGARKLEAVWKNPGSADEAFRAAWHLWDLYGRAGLGGEARKWLDRVLDLRPVPAGLLDRAWDQTFRLGDPAGGRSLWPGTLGYPGDDDRRKARLLRQKLFLGTRALAPLGADEYVSALVLDRDDLWAGTWNGAVVRWSLATDQADLVLGAGESPAPVKVLAATGWFVYAFQDQGFLRYSKVAGGWRSFDYPPGWTGLRIQAVVPAGDEVLWVATLGQGLWKWDQGQWTLMDDRGGGPFLNALAPDGRGGFWVGTKDRGLWNWAAGVWTPVPGAAGAVPSNISVLAADGSGTRWAVGTWGEGAWLLEDGVLKKVSAGREFAAAAAWDGTGPVWAFLDEGLVPGAGAEGVGPLDGLPSGGVSSLVTWNGRWLWGTTGQGLGWWSEHENPALLR